MNIRVIIKKVAKYFGYSAYLLLTCTLLLEASLRVYLYEEEATKNYWGIGAFQADDEVGYIHNPNFTGRATRRPDFICNIEINKHGLREKDMEKQLKYEERFLFIGDSFTLGLGVEEEEMFSNRITEVLNVHGIGVINGGQTGYCINYKDPLLCFHAYQIFN